MRATEAYGITEDIAEERLASIANEGIFCWKGKDKNRE